MVKYMRNNNGPGRCLGKSERRAQKEGRPRFRLSRAARLEMKRPGRKKKKSKYGNDAWRKDPRFEKKFSLVGENITESTESDLIEVKKNHTILREEKKRRQAFTSKTFAEMRGFYLRSDSEGNEGTETRSKLHPITQHGPLSQSRPHARRMDSISRKKSRVVGEDEVEDEDQQEVVEKVNEEELTSNSLSWRETVQRVRAGQMSLKELEKQLKIRARATNQPLSDAVTLSLNLTKREEIATMFRKAECKDGDLPEQLRTLENQMENIPMFPPENGYRDDSSEASIEREFKESPMYCPFQSELQSALAEIMRKKRKSKSN